MALPKTKQGKRAKAAQVMREFADETLHSGSGAKVTKPAQARAIAMAESGQARPKQTRRPASRVKARAPDVVTVKRS